MRLARGISGPARFLWMTAAPGAVILFTFLPFLPGPYDPVALTLSMMARVAGLVALLFTSVGGLALVARGSRCNARCRRALAAATLVVSMLVWIAVALAAFGMGSRSLFLICLAAGTSVVLMVASRREAWTAASTPTLLPPLYWLTVPVAVFLLQQVLLEPAVEFSRDRAIRNSRQLIADIDRYRTTRGHYPPSLLSVNKDYSPGIIGIEKYHYEPSGDAFNLLFEQPAAPLGTREFVVYNPRDEQTATSHALDLLQFAPERLEQARGYYAVHEAAHAHWKYFWFD